MSLDRQVKVELILEATQALNNVERLSKAMKEISTASLGGIEKQMTALVAATQGMNKELIEITKSTQSVSEAMSKIKSNKINEETEKAKTFAQELAEVKRKAEEIFRNGGDMKDITGQFHQVTSSIIELKKSMGDMSLSAEKGYWEKFIRGLSASSPLLDLAKEKIKELKKEMKAISEIGKQNESSQSKSTLQSYYKELTDVKRKAEEIFRNGGDMSGVTQQFHQVTSSIIAMRKAMGDMSLGAEKGYWSKFVSNLSKDSMLYEEGIQKIQELNAKMAKLKADSAAPVETTYKKQIAELNAQAEKLYRSFNSNKLNNAERIIATQDLEKVIAELAKVREEYNKLREKVQGKPLINTKESVEQLKTYKQELAEIKRAAEVTWKTDGDMGAVTDRFHKVSSEMQKMYKEMGDLSVNSEISYWKKFIRGLDKDSPVFQQAKQNIEMLKKELDQINEIGKKTTTPQVKALSTGFVLPTDFASYQTKISDTKKEMQALEQAIKGANTETEKNNLGARFEDAKKRLQVLNSEFEKFKIASGEKKAPTIDNSEKFVSYAQQMSDLKIKAEGFHQTIRQANDEVKKNEAVKNLKETQDKLNAVRKDYDNFKKSIHEVNSSFLDFNALAHKMKNHLLWIGTGELLRVMIDVPKAMIGTIRDVEQGMAGMKQTMHDSLATQEQVNKATHDFIGIAAKYGESVTEIIEAGKLWSRGYKDMNTVQNLMHSSAILAVADNFSMAEANRALEATMMQLGWQARNAAEATAYSMRIVDSWTWVSHNAQVSAQDLALANERSAASARLVGVEFDLLQGLIATGVKNTGRSGAEIGNMLKTVFGSIHSAKAIKEIEAMGVAVYEFGENGEKNFRKVGDVLLELSIATQGAEKNIEELMKGVAGGKFQWSKFAATLDYESIIKAMSLSVNSMGKGHEQMLIQMDTIARKAEQVKANLTNAIMSVGDGGLTAIIKTTLDIVNKFLTGLQNLNATAVKSVFALGGIALSLYVLQSILARVNTFLITWSNSTDKNTSANQTNNASVAQGSIIIADKTGKIIQNTIATNLNTNAQLKNAGAVGAVGEGAKVALEKTGALTGVVGRLGGAFGIVGIAIQVALAAMAAYAMFSKTIVDEQRDTIKKHEDLVAVKIQEIEITKKQSEFLNTLGDAYFKIKDSMVNYAEGSEHAQKALKNLEITENEMQATLGETTYAEWERAGKTKEAYEEVKVAHSNKVNKMKEDLSALQTTQREYLAKAVTAIKKEISEYEKATSRFKDSVLERIKWLGTLATAIGIVEDMIATTYENYAKFNRDLGNAPVTGEIPQSANTEMPDIVPIMGAPETGITIGGAALDKASRQEEIAKDLRQQQQDRIDKLGVTLYEKGNSLMEKLLSASKPSPGDWSSPIGSGVDDTDSGGSGKGGSGGSGKTAPNWEEERRRAEWKRKESDLILQLKLHTDAYAESLDNLATKEKLEGHTAQTTLARLAEYRKHSETVKSDMENVVKLREEMEDNLTQAVASDNELLGTMVNLGHDWSAMSKEQRLDAIATSKEFKQNAKDIDTLLQLIDKLKSKESDLKKETTKTKNNIDEIVIGKSKNPDAQRDLKTSKINEQYSEDMLNNSKKFSPFSTIEADLTKLRKLREEEELLTIQLAQYNKQIEILKAEGVDYTEVQKNANNVKVALNNIGKEAIETGKKLEQNVRQKAADIFIDMAQNGASFKDIWKKLWNDLAKDALYALMKINNGAPSLLTQIFGLFGGVKKPTAGTPKTQHNGGIIGYPKMHDGGNVFGHSIVPNLRSDEVIRTLQVGEEVNSIQQRRSNEILGAVAMKALDTNNARPNNIVIQAIDSRSFVEYMDGHGATLVSILRKQNALGNR